MSCPVAATPESSSSSQAGVSRAPCPALNTLANHGILPQDGKNISVVAMSRAMRDGYHLTWPLAIFLTIWGWVLIRRWGSLNLEDLAIHNGIEHNASLAHEDASEETSPSYAPIGVNVEMLGELLKGSEDGKVFTAVDIARARVRREATYTQPGAIDAVHQEIGRGEMAIALQLFGDGKGIPLEDLRVWFQEERFPDSWTGKGKRVGLLATIRVSKIIRDHMTELRKHRAT